MLGPKDDDMPQRQTRSGKYPERFLDVLSQLADDWDGGDNYFTGAGHRDEDPKHPINSLMAGGLVEQMRTSLGRGYYPTLAGMDRLERHQHRLRVWFRENWFALAIAVVSSIIGLANIIIVATSKYLGG